jgi:integrase
MKHDYTLFKRKGQKVWYFHYYENDIRQSKSTGKTLKFEAEEVAFSFIEKKKNPKKNITLNEYTQDFFDWDKCMWIKRQHSKGHNFSIDMAQQRRGHLKNFILPKFGKFMLTELNSIQIENWLINIDRANQTKNNMLSTFKIVTLEATQEGLIPNNPLERVKQLARQSVKRDIFKDDEIELLFPEDDIDLFALWDEQRIAVAMYIIYCTGIRSGELRALKWKNVIWDDDQHGGLVIESAVKNNQDIGLPKNGKSRVVIMDKRAVQLLEDWLENTPFDGMDDLIFYGSSQTTPMERALLSRKLAKVMNSLEMDTTKRNLVVHSFRHTFNTRMRRVLPQEILQALTGHQSKEMSDHYDHPEIKTIYFSLRDSMHI